MGTNMLAFTLVRLAIDTTLDHTFACRCSMIILTIFFVRALSSSADAAAIGKVVIPHH